MTQQQLALAVGIRFQQIQKYEKGVNRIGASRLFKLSQVLEVPVQFFFDDMPATEGNPIPGMAETDAESFLYEFLNTRDGLELNRAFVKVTDPEQRRSIVELVRSISRNTEKSSDK